MTKKNVTITEVAKQSGFSIATVSRVLNNDPTLSVNIETRDIIFETANQLGYRKKAINPLIKDIALLYWVSDIEELQDVYFKQMRIELERICANLNVELHIYKKQDGIKAVKKTTNGFIAIGAFKKEELKHLDTITEKGVFLDINPNVDKYDCAKSDLSRITDIAIDHFLSEGIDRIGFIGGTFFDPDFGEDKMDERELRFRQTLMIKDKFDERFVFADHGFSVDTGYRLMSKAIETLGDDLPDAFFIAADPIAVGALQALNEHEISVPGRVRLISINNISVAKYVSPPLSTFNIEIALLCESAVKLLIERIIEKRTVSKTILVNSELILRKTT